MFPALVLCPGPGKGDDDDDDDGDDGDDDDWPLEGALCWLISLKAFSLSSNSLAFFEKLSPNRGIPASQKSRSSSALSVMPGLRHCRISDLLCWLYWVETFPIRRADESRCPTMMSGRLNWPEQESLRILAIGAKTSRVRAWYLASSLSLDFTGAGSLLFRTLSKKGADA